jgi:O-antigen/teichoic acid export membrane protein
MGRRVTTIIAAQGIGAVLSALAVLIITRSIGMEGYGTVKLAISFAALFSFIPNLGLFNAHIKRVSEGRDLGDCMGTLAVMEIPLIILLVVVLLFTIRSPAAPPVAKPVLYIAVGYQAILSIRSAVWSTFIARRESAKEQLSFLIDPVLRVSLVVLLAFFLGGGNGEELMVVYLLGILGSLIFALYGLRGISIHLRINRDFIRSYWNFAKHLIPLTIISVIAVNLDKVLIGVYQAELQVGQYSTAQMITALINQIPLAFGVLLFPTISSSFSQGGKEEIRSITRFMGRYLSMIVLPAVVYLVVFGESVLGLFSGAQGAYVALIILALYAFIYALGVPYTNLLLGIDRPDVNSRILITGHIITMGLGIVLIPIRGMVGGALALLIAYLLVFLLAAFASKRLVGAGIGLMGKSVLYHLLAGGATALLMLPISLHLSTNRWFHVVGLAFLVLGVYFAILFLLGEFKKDDFNFFKESLNPANLMGYIRDEVMGKNR